MRLAGRGRPWWWTIGPALGVGAIGLAVPVHLTLQRGGLAAVVVSATMAALVATPLAREDWLNEDSPSPTNHMETAFAHLAILGSLAAMGSTFANETREIVLLGTVAVLGLAVGPHAAWMGVAGWLLMMALGGLTLGVAPGWTVLEPTVHTWRSWLAPAMTIGALLGGAPGGWRWFAPAAPGRSNVPFLSTGLLVAALLAISLHHAALHEVTLGGPAATGSALVLAMAGTATWMSRPTSSLERLLDLALFGGLLTTFTIDGLPDLWWTLTCPALVGAYGALNAWRTRRLDWVVFSILMLGAIAVSTSSTPPSALLGMLVVIPWVLAVWIGGTRTLLART